MTHTHQVRIYYEDTDLGGIVYYANYLKFIERARTEWVRALGLNQSDLRAAGDGVFAVRRVLADYLAPARMDDLLDVTTTYASHSGARLVLDQRVLRGAHTLFTAQVTLVCLNDAGRPQPLPRALTRHLPPNPANKPEV